MGTEGGRQQRKAGALASGSVWSVLPWILALLAFVWVLRSPINQAGSDPRGSLLVSQALLETRSIRLDDYAGPAQLPSRNLVVHDGRVDYLFPLGAPLAGLPAVWLARRLGMDMVDPLDEARLHKWLAALSVALALLLAHRLARLLLEVPAGGATSRRNQIAALVLSGVTVLGSGLVSTLGTAFWSNDVAAVLNLAGLVLLVDWVGEDGSRDTRPAAGLSWSRALILGLVLFGAALARPSSALLAGLALLYVAWTLGWISALRLGFGMVLPALAFFGVSFWDYGHPLPPYYRPSRLSGTSTFGRALAGNLVSPGRGLLVFSPWLLVTLFGAAALARSLTRKPLFWLAALWALAQLLTISAYPHWWDGHSFGSRPYVEALPALLLLSVLTWRELGAGDATLRRAARETAQPAGRPARPPLALVAAACFLLLGVFSIWVHAGQGLYNLHTVMWNGGDWGPRLGDINVDQHPEYLWDWRFPQMLASEAMLVSRYRDFQLRALPVLSPGQAITAESDPRFFEGDGWQAVERAGEEVWRWTEGRWDAAAGEDAPAIVFRMRLEDREGSGWRIELEAGSFEGQTLTLVLNGVEIGRFAGEGHFTPRAAEFALPIGLLTEANRLELRAPEAHEAGNGDPRRLGLAFRRLQLLTD